ncbi:hypothetical protein J3R83DRAFT_5647 [Lanmaoa asiatica]|nr:hypothetical protein J3R83DRAFT_5647 [Lanmaoa asiatica]
MVHGHGGKDAALEVIEGVRNVLQIVRNATSARSGEFCDEEGNLVPHLNSTCDFDLFLHRSTVPSDRLQLSNSLGYNPKVVVTMRPPPQRLQKAEFDVSSQSRIQGDLVYMTPLQKLINGAVKHSIQTFSKLTGFARDDTCLPTQYIHIVSVMYDQLDANKIPPVIAGQDIPVEGLDLAFASLIGLGMTLPLWLCNDDLWQQLAKGLCTHWSDIRRWVLFLYRSVITQEDLGLDMRYACKTAVLEFLGLVRDRLLISWSKTIPTDREIMKMICGLWFIETRDPLFSSWSPKANTQRESAVFNSCFLIAHELGNTIDWGNLLGLFQGEPELIATVSLCHLDHEISHEDDWDLNCIAWDLHIITMLSFRENICLALMRQGAIKAASEILAFVVDREWKGEARVFASRCMVNAIVLLRTRIEDMDGLPFLSQALTRGLVPSLLKCESLLPFVEQPPAHRQPAMLLEDILPGYTVYRSVLHMLALAVDLAIEQRLDARLPKGGELYKAWKRLKDTVDERRRLVRRDVANGHIQSCQNDKVARSVRKQAIWAGLNGVEAVCMPIIAVGNVSSTIGKTESTSNIVHEFTSDSFGRVGGVLFPFDRWHACMNNRPHAGGQMSTVHSKDLKFLDQVILAELKKHRTRLDAHPSKVTLIELNLIGGQVNVAFDARGTNANPFGTKCGCEMFANARWKRMAEMMREGKRPMVLVRAFIPGGLSRKIVLQAIPLSAVVEGGQGERRRNRVMEKYQCNLIFTCCGSEGNNPKGKT